MEEPKREDFHNSVGGAMEYYEELSEYLKVQLKEKNVTIEKLDHQLRGGRDYLMQVSATEITVGDSLESFGFGRNGLRSN